MKTRRTFLGQALAGTVISATSGFPFSAWIDEPSITKITILHTNDMHSRIDPFPENSGRNSGMGGVSRRAAVIAKIRQEEPNVILLDSGDIFQGTPYFNFFGGELEFKSMSHMGYDVATMGNHDFDGGMDGFKQQLKHADFDFVVSNYGFENTILDGIVGRHKIIEKGGIKIGILGIGIELEGLVPQSLYGETQYYDPITYAQREADILKKEMGCDYVICLSHLGYKYRGSKISDIDLANNTSNIDLILGGHTHTFLEKPDIQKNTEGEMVHISQCGWAGIVFGRIDVHFEKSKKKTCTTCQNTILN